MKTQIVTALIAIAVFLVPSASHARWLNPDTGRFQTMDTYEGVQEEPQSIHKYTYAQNNPVNNVDPSGNEIEGLLAVMNISTVMYAQMSPATAGAAVTAGVAGTSRPLTQGEITLGTSMFGGKINYTKVNVFRKKQNPLHPKDTLITPDGNIYANPKGNAYSTDYSSVPTPGQKIIETSDLFIHEMTHVWQFQSGVNVVAQAVYRKYDYNYSKLGTIKFVEYGIEQQATIVEDYYLVKNGYTKSKNGVPVQLPSAQTYQKVTSPYFP